MPDENAFSLFIRGPAMQECSLQFVTESNTFRWKFGRGQESEAVVSSRVMSEEEHDDFVDVLNDEDII